MRTATGLLAQLVFSMTVFAFNMLFISIAGALRLLPVMLPVLARAGWSLLLLSCRLYYLALTRTAPWIKAHLGINLLEGLGRVATTGFLSLTLGGLFLIIAQWPLTIWTVLPLLAHGLFVDFVWDDIPQQGGLQMGVRL